MSKIYKSSNITIDENNRVNILVEKLFDYAPEVLEEDSLNENLDTISEKASDPTLNQAPIKPPEPEITAEEIIANARLKEKEIIESAKLREASILGEVENEAAKIKETAIQEAEIEASKIRDDAKDEGYTAGHEEGFDIGKEEADSLIKEAEKIKEDALMYKDELIANTEPEMVELILSMVKKIISDEIDINPQVIVLLLKRALQNVNATGDVAVHISSEDFANVIENKNEILSSLDTSAKIEFIEDSSLKKADCVINTSIGGINCNIGEQYKELEKNMYFLLKNR